MQCLHDRCQLLIFGAPSIVIAGIDTLSKLIGDEWKNLSDEAKAPYVQMAEVDQGRYRKEMIEHRKLTGASSSDVAEDDDEEEEEDDDEDDEPADLKAENKALKAQVAALEKKAAKQQKLIEVLQNKLAGKPGKASGGKPAAEASASPKSASKATEEDGKGKKDSAHYLAWTKGVLGANGEKADAEMLKVLGSKGPKGLAKFLMKQYRAEHS